MRCNFYISTPLLKGNGNPWEIFDQFCMKITVLAFISCNLSPLLASSQNKLFSLKQANSFLLW